MWSSGKFGFPAATRLTPALRRLHALSLLLLLFVCGAVAPTSLADQAWIVGVYDGGDADDAIRVLSVTEGPAEERQIFVKVRPPIAVSRDGAPKIFAAVTCSGPPSLRSPPA